MLFCSLNLSHFRWSQVGFAYEVNSGSDAGATGRNGQERNWVVFQYNDIMKGLGVWAVSYTVIMDALRICNQTSVKYQPASDR